MFMLNANIFLKMIFLPFRVNLKKTNNFDAKPIDVFTIVIA